jgi:hypothetical protein
MRHVRVHRRPHRPEILRDTGELDATGALEISEEQGGLRRY